jgi:hypothetical protein
METSIATFNKKSTTSSKMQSQDSLLNEAQLYATELLYNVNEDELKSAFKEIEPIRLAIV